MPEITVKSGLVERTDLVARPLAAPAPERTLAPVTRRTSARTADFKLRAEFIREAHARELRATLTSRGRRGNGGR